MEFEANYQKLKQELEDGPSKGNILYYVSPKILMAKIEDFDEQIASMTKERNRLELRRRLIDRINAKARN